MTLHINPTLAVALGSINAAIILQHLHDLISSPQGQLHQRQRWYRATYEQWQQHFPWASVTCVRHTINRLEDMKLITSQALDECRTSRTKWYTVNYKAIKSLKLELYPANGD